MDRAPPPFPTFLVQTLNTCLLALYIANDSSNTNVPPPFLPAMNMIAVVVYLLKFLGFSETLLQLLFRGAVFSRNYGRDIWQKLEKDPRKFWYATGDTIISLDRVVQAVAAEVVKPRMLPRMPISGRRRSCILDVKNRVILVVIWLRNYPTYYSLASLFGISKSTVQEEIYHVVPILFLQFRNLITWHNLRQWSSFLGHWRNFPNAVGIVDATIHRIRRPSGRRQGEFYRGDKKTHFMSTQLIVDADGMIVMLISG